MKAVVVKNNDFKTVGFEVTSGDHTIFLWGVAPCSALYFQKEVDVNKYMADITRLIKLETMMNCFLGFKRNFFQVLEDSGVNKHNGYNLSSIDNEIDNIALKMDNIINSII